MRTEIGTVAELGFRIGIGMLLLSVLTACGSDRVYTLGEVGAAQEAESVEDGAFAETETGTTSESAAGPESASAAQPVALYVYVCGAVQSPGVYELPEGSRARDALAAAGGFADGADETYVNLARALTDGEQLYFPTEEEVRERAAQGNTTGGGSSAGASDGFPGETASGANSSGAGAGGGARVNLNTADEAALCTLPGIGSAKARAILAYREEHGGFSAPEELLNVSGIGEASYAKLQDYITVY